jgi:serine/threonine protein kinase
MIGRTISHYRILEKLGEGGMGVVYLAEDTVLGRRVAIKTLTTRGGDNKHFRTRFLREARAVSALSHPHIAHIYDYGETEDDEPYIVMELIKGTTLGDLMAKETLTIPRAIEIIKEVAEALGEAHRQGIVHRDIKPSNVAINERGSVKVLDFGLAKQIDIGAGNPIDAEQRTLLNTQTKEGVIVGTPMYLSPEQALGVEVDARTDLFALGGLLYECIAGKPAFSGGSPIEICAKVIREDPPPPSQLNSSVTREMDRIVLKALAKKPNERYQSADEMIADLSAAEESLSRGSDRTVTRLISSTPGSQPTGAIATLSDIFKRPRLPIGYVAAAILVLTVVAVSAYYFFQNKPHKPLPEAQKWHDIGVNYLREGAYFKAIKPLEQAIALDDKFALAHARLAEAWTELDYPERAQLELLRVHGLVPDTSILEHVDRLYLDATRATITRDFAGAITANQEIVRLKPNDAQAYLDLGRAFEKNDEIDKAIENFNAAVTNDSQYAAAHLRLGILYGRKEVLDKATAAFDKADALFQTLGDIEGRAEVLYQRGVVSNKTGKLDEAEEQLRRAFDLSRSSNNQYQQIKTMLQLSTVLHTRGKTAEAKQNAVDAVKLAESAGIENLATQGLIDLGDTYLVRGEYVEAEQVLMQALQFARRNKGRRNEAMALLRLAKLLIQQEIRTDEALGYIEQSLQYFQQGGYNKEVSLAILLRGRARLFKGDYQSALQDFQQQLQFAQTTNNRAQLASTYLLIGNLYKDLEQYPDALKSFEQSYAVYKSLDVPITMGYLIVYQSEMLAHLGRADDARALLNQLPPIANRLDSKFQQTILARMALAESQIALSEDRVPDARDKAARALTLSGGTTSHTGVEAAFLLALTQVRSGVKAEGLKSMAAAVEYAKAVHDEHLLSLTMLGHAEALLESGDAKASLQIARDVQQRFARASQHESEWRAWFLIAQASAKLNDTAGARDATRRASEVLAALEQKWGAEASKGYAARSDIATRRKQIDALLNQ